MEKNAVPLPVGVKFRSPLRSVLRGLARAFIILILFGGLLPPLARAASSNGYAYGHGRLAQDLREMLARSSPDERITVVVNLKNGSQAEETLDRINELGGNVRSSLKHVQQLVVEIPLGAVEALAVVPGLEYVAPDRVVRGLASHIGATTGASQVYPPSIGVSLSGFLISGGLVGYDGSGIGVAVVDSGVDPDHFDLRDGGRRRVVHSADFVKSGSSDDPYGHGTHVAGTIAGNGSSSLQSGHDYTGIAPGAHLVSLRVLDDYGRGTISGVIAAIDYAIANRALWNLRVLNLSLAAPPVDSHLDDPLCHAVERAAWAGLVVVTAAGNFGTDAYGNTLYGSITSPGISPAAITVGSVDTRGTDSRSDDRVAVFSSRGPTRSHRTDETTGEPLYDDLAKPDLVAPGMKVVSLERHDSVIIRYFPFLHVSMRSDNPKSRYMYLSGTSMSSGVVSGAAALILQANPSLTPNMVKAILMYSAEVMSGEDLFEQGAGSLNVEGAMRLARAMRNDAGTRLPGQTLIPGWMPRPQSTIAGEPLAWSQSIIWGRAFATGTAAISRQQEAYARSIIWGRGEWSVWGSGVTWLDGIYAVDHVVYGRYGGWDGVVWDSATRLENGVLFRDDLSAVAADWQQDLIAPEFYTLDGSSIIWGYRLGDQGLIWGFLRYLFDMGLIWGLAGL
jgi:subtilisin family serine protease